MPSLSRINVKIPVEGEDPIIEQYDIDALRLVDPISRNPYEVGSATVPVYFADGHPVPCEGGGGGGTGGSNVTITPNYRAGNLVAKYTIDGVAGSLYSPKTNFVYKRVDLWTGTLSDVGDNNTNNPFRTTIGNYNFLLVHYAPSNNINEERTMMFDALTFVNSIATNNAIFSCHYLSDVFIKVKFNSQDKIEVVESRTLPLSDGENPQLLKCVIKRIEGLTFGVSGEDMDQGLTVRKTLWGPASLDEVGETAALKETIESYNYIYIHYCINDNLYDEKILILDKDAVMRGLEQNPSEAYFNCYVSDNLYIKGLFTTTAALEVTEVQEDLEHEKKCIIRQIDGICMGSVATGSGEGGDISTCMIKGVDYVTAGRKNNYFIGEQATAEGEQVWARGDYSHAEGYETTAGGNSSHAEGYQTICLYNDDLHYYGDQPYYAHAEGQYTTVIGPAAHGEGVGTYTAGEASHAEGSNTSAYGYASHAEGSSTYSDNGHTEGAYTSVLATCGHAEGYQTLATSFSPPIYIDSGKGAHAEGMYTTAKNQGDHAEGCATFANSNGFNVGWDPSCYGAHAEGLYTCAFNHTAHSEGYSTLAYGEASHSGGIQTSATNYASCSIGKLSQTMDNSGSRTNQNGTAFIIGNGYYNELLGETIHSNAFSVLFNGVYSSLNTQHNPGQDYAENFEWSDSNINEEDRVGYFVTFDENDKIRIATSNDDYILGITSGSPSVLGNSDCDDWNGKYLRDNFNRFLEEDAPLYKINSETGEEEPILDDEGNQVYQGKRFVLNPDYDSSQEYVRRSERPEWAPVGMLGVLSVRDDGTCQVNKYCKVNDNGIATYQATYNKNENYYRVIERVAENIVKVVFR